MGAGTGAAGRARLLAQAIVTTLAAMGLRAWAAPACGRSAPPGTPPAGKGEAPGASRRRQPEARVTPGPRDAQIARLKAGNDAFRRRLAQQDTAISEHITFRQQAISRLAAQHEELQRLRDSIARSANPGARTAALTVLHPHQEDIRP